MSSEETAVTGESQADNDVKETNADDITATAQGSTDTQPLLPCRTESSRRRFRFMLIGILAILLLGGLGVTIWLVADLPGSGSGTGGGSVTTWLVNRTMWNARSPRHKPEPLPHLPATHVVVIHTESQPCATTSRCELIVKNIQDLHMDGRNYEFSDIAYSFLTGGDGLAYEGRGWDVIGAFARGMNKKAIGVAFIGTFHDVKPPPSQLKACQTLIRESLKLGHLDENYVLIGHLQVSNTTSPGQALYHIIQTWPHWKDCYKTTC